MITGFALVLLIFTAGASWAHSHNNYSSLTDGAAPLSPDGTEQLVASVSGSRHQGGESFTTFNVTINGTVAIGDVTSVLIYQNGTFYASQGGSFGSGSNVVIIGSSQKPNFPIQIYVTLAASAAGKTVGVTLALTDATNDQGLPLSSSNLSISGAGCTTAAPTANITTAPQTITSDNGSVNYNVDITNNDAGAGCTNPLTINLVRADSNGNFTSSIPASVSLAPGASTTVTLTVSEQTAAALETTTTTVTASAAGHPNGNDSVLTTYDPAAPCIRNAPTFSMGVDQSIAPAGSAVYTLSITNNDTAGCANSTWNIIILSETGDTGNFTLPSVLSSGSATVAPGATDTTVTLTVNGDGSGTGGEFLDSTVRIQDNTDHAGQDQNDTVRTTISAGCTYSDPTVTITPNTRFVSQGSFTQYIVNVTNNDSAGCPSSNFVINKTDTPGVPNADFSASTLDSNSSGGLAPGDTWVTNLTHTAAGGASIGATQDSYVTTVADGDHAAVQSNTVTTQVAMTAGAGDGMLLRRSAVETCHSCHKTNVNRVPADADWDEAIKIHSSALLGTCSDSNYTTMQECSTNGETWTHGRWGANGWGVSGGLYGAFDCTTCHNAHDTRNIYIIKETINTPDGSNFAGRGSNNVSVDLRYKEAYDTGNPKAGTMGRDDEIRASSDKICEVCHTYDAGKVNGVNQHAYSMAGAVSHKDATTCTDCHMHIRGFMAAGGDCISCHSLVQGNRRDVANVDLVKTSHHIQDITGFAEESCMACHGDLVTDKGHDATSTGDPITELQFPDSGTYFTVNGATGLQLETFCVECHDADGASRLGINADKPFTDSGDNTVPVNIGWSAGAMSHSITDACFNCHGNAGAGGGTLDPVGNAHGSDWTVLLSDSIGGETVANAEEELCFACHDGSPASTDIEAQFAGTETATSGSDALLNTRHDVYDADQTYSGAVIECTDCHNPHTVTASAKLISDPDPGDGRVPAAGNTWADSTVMSEFCLDCHDNSFPSSITPPTNPMVDNYDRWTLTGGGDKADQHGADDGSNDPNLRAGSGYAKGDILQCTDCHNAGHGDEVGGNTYTNLFNLKSIIYSKDGSTPLPPDVSIPSEDPNLVRVTDVSGGNTDPLTNSKAFCSTCHPNPMGGNKSSGCLSGNCHAHGTSSF